jgi:hypothetical protein
MTNKMIIGGLAMTEPDRRKIAVEWALRGFSCDLMNLDDQVRYYGP